MKKCLALLLALCMLLTLVPATALANEPVASSGPVTLAAWASANLNTSHGYDAITGANSFNPRWDAALGLASTPGTARLNFVASGTPRTLAAGSGGINAGTNLNDLENDAYWHTVISTVGHENISVEWNFRSTNTGPRDWQLQYSTNGTAWNAVGGPIVIVNTGGTNPASVNVASHFDRTLPATAEGHANLQLRWLMTSNTAVNGTSIATAGTNQVGNILITGTPEQPDPPAAPTANPATGATLPHTANTVTLATETAGAVIVWRMNSGTGFGSGWQTGTAAQVPANTGTEARTVTIEARARLGADLYSGEPVTFTFIQDAPPPPRTYTLRITLLNPPAAPGARFDVFFDPSAGTSVVRDGHVWTLTREGNPWVGDFQVFNSLGGFQTERRWVTRDDYDANGLSEFEITLRELFPPEPITSNPASGHQFPVGEPTNVTFTTPTEAARVRWVNATLHPHAIPNQVAPGNVHTMDVFAGLPADATTVTIRADASLFHVNPSYPQSERRDFVFTRQFPLTLWDEEENEITAPVAIDSENSTVAVTVVGGEGAIELEYAAPAGVTVGVNQTTGVITITAAGTTAIDEEFDIVVTRGSATATLTVTVDFTPPAFAFAPASVTINNDALEATAALVGDVTGDNTGYRILPDQQRPHISYVWTAEGIALTGTRPAVGEEAIIETFTVEVDRGGLTAILTVNVNLTPPPTLILTPTTVQEINDDNLVRTVAVTGTAMGAVTFNRGTLPANVELTVSANPTITVTGTRPAHGQEPIVDTFTVGVLRGGVTENLIIPVNLTPLPAGPATVYFRTLPFTSNPNPEFHSEPVTIGDPVQEPETHPEPPAGYEFAGWFRGYAEAEEWDFATPVIGTFTLYPRWEPIMHTVTFLGAGGTWEIEDETHESIVLQVRHDSTILLAEGLPPAGSGPHRAGHNFLGWFELDEEEPFDVTTTAITAALTLEARWAQREYRVYFRYQIPDHADSYVEVLHGGTVTEPTAPERDGYRFMGWSTAQNDPDLDDAFDFDTQITYPRSLYAQWEEITLIVPPLVGWITDADPERRSLIGGNATGPITLDTSDLPAGVTATVVPVEGEEGEYEVVVTGARPAPGQQAITGNFTVQITRDDVTRPLAVIVNMTPGMHTVRFFPGAQGTWSDEVEYLLLEVPHGTELTGYPNPTPNAGWELAGWTPSDPVGHEVVANITFTAQWERIMHTVHFRTYPYEAIHRTVTVPSGETLTPLAEDENPTRGGYRFIGWGTVQNAPTLFNFDTPITYNRSLHAQWLSLTLGLDPNPVRVTGGDFTATVAVGGNAENNITLNEDDLDALPAGLTVSVVDGDIVVAFARTYGPALYEGHQVRVMREGVTAVLIVEIDVSASNPTLTFEFPGGEWGTYSDSWYGEVPYGTQPTWAGLGNAPTRPGYVFNGWQTDGESDPVDGAWISELVVTESRTFTATWLEQFTVTFTSGDGNDYMVPNPEMTATENTPFVLPGDHVPGYFLFTPPVDPPGGRFNGWMVEGETELLAEGDELYVTGDITLVAQWVTIILDPAPVDIDNENLTAEVTVGGTATGEIEELVYLLPSNLVGVLELSVDQATGVITITANPYGPVPGGVIDSYVDVTVTRDGVTATVRIEVDLTIVQPTVAFAFPGATWNEVPDEWIPTGAAAAGVLYGETLPEDWGWTDPVNDPASPYYYFAGWQSSADGVIYTTEEIQELVIVRSHVFTAVWVGPEVTVRFDAGVGGVFLEDEEEVAYIVAQIRRGTTLTADHVPTPVPYDNTWLFAGWDTENPVGHVVAGPTTFTAQWERVQRTVTFLPGEQGTFLVDEEEVAYIEETVDHGTVLAAADVPAPVAEEGWRFVGWTPSDPVGHEVEEDITFTAQWEQIEHTVYFRRYPFNTQPNPEITTISVIHGETIGATDIPANPTREGWIFEGWHRQNETEAFDFDTPVEGTFTLYAQWARITHVVTFAPGTNGTLTGDLTVPVEHGAPIPATRVPTPVPDAGWRFTGWTPSLVGHTVEGPITFTAQWEQITLTLATTPATTPVTVEVADGNLSGTVAVGGTATGAITFTEPADWPAGVTLTAAGNVITAVGVRPEPGQPAITGTFTVTVTRQGVSVPLVVEVDLTPLRAFEITFNANEGTGTMASATAVEGRDFTIPANTFTRAGHAFIGWNTLANGEGTEFAPDATIENVQSNMALFAQWGELVDVIFFWNYDVADDKDEEFYETTVILGRTLAQPTPGNPVRAGFAFRGWYLEPENETAKGFTTPVTEALLCEDEGHLRLYARWEEIPEFHGWFMQGNEHGQFLPHNTITRGEVAAILVRTFAPETTLANLNRPPATPFTDIDTLPWAARYVAWAHHHNFIQGSDDPVTGERVFRPLAPVSRQELAAMVARAAELPLTGAPAANFPDVGQTTAWARPYIDAVVNVGWLRGDQNNMLRPGHSIVRAETAAVIARALDRYGAVDAISLAGVSDDLRIFQDVNAGQWYYFLVIEVSHSHYYVAENRNVGTAAAPVYRDMERWVEVTWPAR